MLAFFVCAGVASADTIPVFDEFAAALGRGYLAASPEYNNRRAIYDSNVAKAKLQNENPHRLWTAGTNEFWDWLPSEMTSLLGWSGDARPGQNFGGSRAQPIRKAFLQGNDDKTNQTLPASKSWAHLKTFFDYQKPGRLRLLLGSCRSHNLAGGHRGPFQYANLLRPGTCRLCPKPTRVRRPGWLSRCHNRARYGLGHEAPQH